MVASQREVWKTHGCLAVAWPADRGPVKPRLAVITVIYLISSRFCPRLPVVVLTVFPGAPFHYNPPPSFRRSSAPL